MTLIIGDETIEIPLEEPNALLWEEAYSSDSSLLAYGIIGWCGCGCGDVYTIHLWDLHEGTERFTFTGGNFSDLEFNPNSTLLAGANSQGVALWDVQTGEVLVILPMDVCHVAFSHDGTRIYTANNDGTVRVWGVPNP